MIKEKSQLFLNKDQIIKISDRNNIGCDQVIFIDKDKSNDAFLNFIIQMVEKFQHVVMVVDVLLIY